jgi:hypothetical protein
MSPKETTINGVGAIRETRIEIEISKIWLQLAISRDRIGFQ